MNEAIQILLIVPYLIALITNGFALAVKLWDCKFRGGDLNASDYYICAVALSNLCLQFFLGFAWLCDRTWNDDTFCQVSRELKMICTHHSILIAGALCLFYCTKIVVFKHRLLQLHKRRFSESYRRIIIWTVFSSTIIGLPLLCVKKQEPSTASDSPSFNMSTFSDFYDRQVQKYLKQYKMFILNFAFAIPLLMSLISAGCITVSLVKHVKNMRGTIDNKHGALTVAHRRAVLTVLSLNVLILVHFVTTVILENEVFPKHDLRSTVFEVFSRLYAPMLGIVLVRGNSKLRRVANEMKRKVIETLNTSKNETRQSISCR